MKLLSLTFFLFIADFCCSQVIINEIQSSNASTVIDNYGEYEDWIEIFNASDVAVDIGGLVLKDNVDTWQIPLGDTTTILSPKEYFILWADDQVFQGKFHTNFKLSAANGEFLGLFESDSTSVIDSVSFPPLLDDKSYGKCAGNDWMVFDNPTPLMTNDCPGSQIENQINTRLSIYPTITSANLTIEIPDYTGGIVNVYLYSTDGKMVMNKNDNNQKLTIDLRDLSCGMYILKINSNAQSFCETIIIRK